MSKLNSEEFLAQVDALAIKYHGNRSSEEFIKDYASLHDKYAPEYRTMIQEMHEVYKKVGYPATLLSGSYWD